MATVSQGREGARSPLLDWHTAVQLQRFCLFGTRSQLLVVSRSDANWSLALLVLALNL